MHKGVPHKGGHERTKAMPERTDEARETSDDTREALLADAATQSANTGQTVRLRLAPA